MNIYSKKYKPFARSVSVRFSNQYESSHDLIIIVLRLKIERTTHPLFEFITIIVNQRIPYQI